MHSWARLKKWDSRCTVALAPNPLSVTDGSTDKDSTAARRGSAIQQRRLGRSARPNGHCHRPASNPATNWPQDEGSNIEVGERGGIVVDDQLRTTADGRVRHW